MARPRLRFEVAFHPSTNPIGRCHLLDIEVEDFRLLAADRCASRAINWHKVDFPTPPFCEMMPTTLGLATCSLLAGALQGKGCLIVCSLADGDDEPLVVALVLVGVFDCKFADRFVEDFA